MKICYDKPISVIKKIVQEQAKYQKVLVLYDDTISQIKIQEIYNEIKDLCVYNSMDINSLDYEEIFNGYKIVIYLCSANGILKCDFDKSEFVNIFVPAKDELLPFFIIKDSTLNMSTNYIILNSKKIDFLMLSSMFFNCFIHYFRNILNGENSQNALIFNNLNINNMFDFIDDMKNNTQFIDVDILKNQNIDYKKIILIHIILIDAIMVLLSSIKSKNYILVDVFKAGKENFDLIDKFYKLYFDEMFKNLVLLNYNCLYNYCLKTKQKIKELLAFYNFDLKMINEVVEKVKQYSKEDEGVLAYLYLYNIFNV